MFSRVSIVALFAGGRVWSVGAQRGRRDPVSREAGQAWPQSGPTVPAPPSVRAAVWINKPTTAAAPAEPADQRAPEGALAAEAVVTARIVNVAVENRFPCGRTSL